MNFTAILTADWHIRLDTPKCRTDDYFKAQTEKISFIMELSQRYNCPILIAGDLGDKPTWQNPLLTWMIQLANDKLYPIPGQHDLPYHRLDRWKDGGLGVLSAAGAINISSDWYFTYQNKFAAHCFPYGKALGHPSEMHTISKSKRNIAIAHQMVVKKEKIWPGQAAPQALSLLKKFPEYDLILTGDNHQTFVQEYRGRVLINPGSLMRMTADQESHRPCVFLWQTDNNKVKQIFLPIEENVIDRDYIDITRERDKRIDAFVSHLKSDYEIELSFEKNMKKHLQSNRVKKTIQHKIWQAIGD